LSASAILTVGPDGAPGGTGIGGRASGTCTKAIVRPSSLNSNVETSVASTGALVSCRVFSVVTSAYQMCVASSPCTKNARPALSGDHVAFETRAPAGSCTWRLAPSMAEITWMPTLFRIVSARARLALKSTKTPPSS
jgi:hypothetical protein